MLYFSLGLPSLVKNESQAFIVLKVGSMSDTLFCMVTSKLFVAIEKGKV